MLNRCPKCGEKRRGKESDCHKCNFPYERNSDAPKVVASFQLVKNEQPVEKLEGSRYNQTNGVACSPLQRRHLTVALNRFGSKPIRFKELRYSSEEDSDDGLLSWAIALRNKWTEEFPSEYLTDWAIKDLCIHSSESMLVKNARRIFDLLGGDDRIQEAVVEE